MSINEATGINRIAARLSPHVTNSIIETVARRVGFIAEGSSKSAKIRDLLTVLLGDGRTAHKAAQAIEDLLLEAHNRTVTERATMTTDDVDEILTDMRALRLPLGELGKQSWRRGLKPRPTEHVEVRSPPHAPAAPSRLKSPTARPHQEASQKLQRLLADENAQRRGRELERLIRDVLNAEGLRAVHNVVNPGEQIDVAFVLEGQHYLLECKWEQRPQGLPVVREFSSKVARKAEGTFGVLLSMSGFASDINTTAPIGVRLNVVGITGLELMEILDGRDTFSSLIHKARAAASHRSQFYVGCGR